MSNKLSLDQKHEMASYVYEELIVEASVCEKRCQRLSDALRAVNEEKKVCIAELKKDAFEFKRDIVMGAENVRSGKTIAEKLTRHMEDKIRQRDVLLEKLRLKNASIKAQIQKVELLLKQKEELGDVLHYIDFHQLQIENKQHLAHIEEQNQELLDLKKISGETIQSLNCFKLRLQRSVMDADSFFREIRFHKDVLCKIRLERRAVTRDVISEYRTQRCLDQQQQGTPHMPSILNYVAKKVRPQVSFVVLCSPAMILLSNLRQ
mmetsp:Transcript_13588/g.44283  ORF Transcript_13588/g.44283 Transcript_13588/m.44283 type:complete len:263 (+) Transcript_13588:248-1036(+)